MKKIMFLAVLSLISSLALAKTQGDMKGIVDKYISAGDKMMDLLNANKQEDLKKVESLAIEMADIAKSVSEEYVKLKKDDKKAAALFAKVTKEYAKIKSADFKTLKEGWHDGALVKADPAVKLDLLDESNESYTQPLHSIVHPLMSYQAFKDKNKTEAVSQLTEGQEQIKKTLKLFPAQ